MSASPHLGTQTSAQRRALFIDADPEIRAMPVNILEAGRNIHKCAVENLASGDRGLRLQPVVNFPGPIVALVLGTAAVVVFKLPVETIGTRFGGIPSGMPHFFLRPVLMKISS